MRQSMSSRGFWLSVGCVTALAIITTGYYFSKRLSKDTSATNNLDERMNYKLLLVALQTAQTIQISIPKDKIETAGIQELVRAYQKKKPSTSDSDNRVLIIEKSDLKTGIFTPEDLQEWINSIQDRPDFLSVIGILEINHIHSSTHKKAATGFLPEGFSFYRNAIAFDTLEHRMIAEDAYDLFYKGVDTATRDALPSPEEGLLSSPTLSRPLKFGDVVALAGDFFGVPTEPISGRIADDRRATQERITDEAMNARFTAAFNTLFSSESAISKGLQIMDLARRNPSCADLRYTLTTYGKYAVLGYNNIDHFMPDAEAVYKVGHQLAIQKAIEAHNETEPTAKKKLITEALRLEAFACHFYTDAFAAGHMRVPRRALWDYGGLKAAKYAKQQHDEDGAHGLMVTDGQEEWVAFGDDQLVGADGYVSRELDKQRAYQKVTHATQVAISDIWNSYLAGVEVNTACQFIPRVIANSHNGNALFKQEKDSLMIRENEADMDCTDYKKFSTGIGCSVM